MMRAVKNIDKFMSFGNIRIYPIAINSQAMSILLVLIYQALTISLDSRDHCKHRFLYSCLNC